MEHLDKFLKWLNDNQWLNLIFLLLAVLSIIVSFYLYSKSKRKKKPQYSKRSINVISDTFQNVANVDVSYQGSKINNLTVTKIAIWNGGNETINFSDMASTDRLRIIAEDGITIFNSEVIHQTNPTNNIASTIGNNIVEVSFDYFDQNQGGIIKIIHSGKKSSDLNIKGTFKSAGEIRELNTSVFDVALTTAITSILFFKLSGKKKKSETRLFTRTFPWIALITGLGLLSGYFFVDTDKTSDKVFFAVLGSLYSLFGLGMIFSKNSLPKNFDAFYDDE